MLWLTGHWPYALRRGGCKSPLAAFRDFGSAALGVLGTLVIVMRL